MDWPTELTKSQTPYAGDPTSCRILIVDDEEANRAYLQRLLDLGGYDYVSIAKNGQEALAMMLTESPDIVLLDLQMPVLDGYETLKVMHRFNEGKAFLPVVVLTSDTATHARKAALELGASDFLTKPVDAIELLLRVRNFLTMRVWSQELTARNRDLETRVRQRTQELEDAQIEIVERLALAGEHRDDDTGKHTIRVGRLSALIASRLGLDETTVRLITLAARLHDLGKLAVPDAILLKPDKLTATEFAVVQGHCETGARILSNSRTPLLQMAERIAMAHHERFDGRGYPAGTAQADIPIEARIVAVADVFDALTHDRPYKKAWPVELAIEEIQSQRGRQFDPAVVDAFLQVVDAEAASSLLH